MSAIDGGQRHEHESWIIAFAEVFTRSEVVAFLLFALVGWVAVWGL